MTFNELINMCGDPCKLFMSNYTLIFSGLGLVIVVLIFMRLRKIGKFVGELKQEADALRSLARFPYCDECPYKDICPKRINEMDECTYEYRKSLVADRR